jgi:hypothetical protein
VGFTARKLLYTCCPGLLLATTFLIAHKDDVVWQLEEPAQLLPSALRHLDNLRTKVCRKTMLVTARVGTPLETRERTVDA